MLVLLGSRVRYEFGEVRMINKNGRWPTHHTTKLPSLVYGCSRCGGNGGYEEHSDEPLASSSGSQYRAINQLYSALPLAFVYRVCQSQNILFFKLNWVVTLVNNII